jgi:hypothetical protein
MKLKEFLIIDQIAKVATPEGQLPFHAQAKCVEALYERNFQPLPTKNVRRVVVQCQPTNVLPGNTIFNGIVLTNIHWNNTDFYGLSKSDKKSRVLEILETALIRCAEKFEWPHAPFLEASAAVRSADFENAWRFNSKSSPSRKYIAYVLCEHDIEAFTGTLRIETKQGELLAEKFLFTEYPSVFCYAQHLGCVQWMSSEEVQVLNKNGQIIETLSVPQP